MGPSRLAFAVFFTFVGACSHDAATGSDASQPSNPVDDATLDASVKSTYGMAADLGHVDQATTPDGAAAAALAARPYVLNVPPGYDASKPTPFLVMLHGYNSDSDLEEAYLQFTPVSNAQGFLYARPLGTLDIAFKHAWNATDACCFFQPNKPDDVGYLTAVIDDVTSKYNVDPKRIFIMGHSNGGFMTNLMACELSSRVAAAVTLAGNNFEDPTLCVAKSPVSYLQIHADNDDTINYNGGQLWLLAPPYPAAHATVATWAGKNGCTGALTAAGTIDLVTSVAGEETNRTAYAGCPTGIDVELWTMTGIALSDMPHQPPIVPDFASIVWTFLSTHPKP